MTVHQINPDIEDLFTAEHALTIHEVFDRRADSWTDLDILAGHHPAAGGVIRLEHRELTAAEALLLAQHLKHAAQLLMLWESQAAGA